MSGSGAVGTMTDQANQAAYVSVAAAELVKGFSVLGFGRQFP